MTGQIPLKAVVSGGTVKGLAQFEPGDTIPPEYLSGAGSTDVTLPAGAVITGLRVVRASSGSAYSVDTSVQAHAEQVLGVALQSVTAIGTDVDVLTSGLVTDSGWAWSDGDIFCGSDGSLTQAPAATGWLLRVGSAVSPTSFLIDLGFPIYRG